MIRINEWEFDFATQFYFEDEVTDIVTIDEENNRAFITSHASGQININKCIDLGVGNLLEKKWF